MAQELKAVRRMAGYCEERLPLHSVRYQLLLSQVFTLGAVGRRVTQGEAVKMYYKQADEVEKAHATSFR